MNKLIVAGALVVSTLAWALVATARPGFGGPGRGIEGLASELGLSAEQASQVSELMDAARLEAAVDRERKRQIREDLRALAHSFDPGAAQILADELGAVVSRLSYNRALNMSQVLALLTEEQRALFERRHADRVENFGRLRGASGSFLRPTE